MDRRVYSAVIACNGVWPAELVSGVMFYDGYRVTAAEFIAAGGRIGATP
ncbi:hypothetical protein IP90_00991 [Luteimonas cucumeris]|uniref:Uncharacterized protein n=1 Tax=Luteimonas cucumeris TaxID=985012 RepID=A0A562LB37_9GAMM|nr:hypothetical protein [Luteimonas cucumeris]TWI04851.1 hypothetical protein IP90_00991 [Luteimonas cucumeris]